MTSSSFSSHRADHHMLPLLRLQEVADLLNISPAAVKHWADEGLLPAYKIGPRRDWRFKAEDMQAILESHYPL